MPFLSNTGPKTSLLVYKYNRHLITVQTPAALSPPLLLPTVLPQSFLFHRRYNFCVNVHVEVELEAEALLAGVLQGEQTHR